VKSVREKRICIRDNGTDNFKLTYAEIEEIAGVTIDHSLLKYKKELLKYGFCGGKISMKEETFAIEFKCGFGPKYRCKTPAHH
jgi:hypothetical protein